MQDIQEKKLSLISWISQLEDITLIDKLTDIREDEFEVHQWQKDIVLKRIKKSKESPE